MEANSPQSIGGLARAESLTAKERRDIASNAARARWHGKRGLQIVTVKDYGRDDINRLARAGFALEEMEPGERLRALQFFKSKFAKEWPSDL